MARKLRQQRLRGFLGSRALTLTLLVAAGTVSLAFGREIARRVSVQQELERLTGEIATAEQSTKDLENLIAALKSPSFQEGAARTQLNLQKPGENVLVIPAATPGIPGPTNTATQASADQPAARSNAQRWWNYLFGTHAT